MNNKHGLNAEDIVEKICQKMFFSDFTVRDLKFKKQNGLEKEAADLFVLYNNMLIVFQIKSKIETKPLSKKANKDFDRIQKKIIEAIGQFNTTKNVLKKGLLKKITTTRGFTINFDSAQLQKTIGVVIINLAGEEAFEPKEQTQITYGYSEKYNKIPIHIFNVKDFYAMSEEVDTMPDFISYLEAREVLISRNQIVYYYSESDLLALYITNYPLIKELLENEKHLILIELDYLKNIKARFQAEFKKRNAEKEFSFIFDDVINHLHTSAGYDCEYGEINFGQGTVEAYLEIARELARYPRVSRIEIGKKMYEKCVKAILKEVSYYLFINPEDNSGYFFLSFNGTRDIRKQNLEKFTLNSYCAYDLSKIVGIATEPANIKHLSYDFILLSGLELKEEYYLKCKNEGLKYFKETVLIERNEFS